MCVTHVCVVVGERKRERESKKKNKKKNHRRIMAQMGKEDFLSLCLLLLSHVDSFSREIFRHLTVFFCKTFCTVTKTILFFVILLATLLLFPWGGRPFRNFLLLLLVLATICIAFFFSTSPPGRELLRYYQRGALPEGRREIMLLLLIFLLGELLIPRPLSHLVKKGGVSGGGTPTHSP